MKCRVDPENEECVEYNKQLNAFYDPQNKMLIKTLVKNITMGVNELKRLYLENNSVQKYLNEKLEQNR